MTVPLLWPADYYYEPIGSTSATCLTRDLPPEAPANILVLDSTDCRNILFTLHCELVESQRKLDFTCSDVDPGNLARATLLLTMVMDSVPLRKLWNIFFHTHLDEDSLTLLASHCRKLIDSVRTMQDWNGTIYGAMIRFGSEHTFTEVRRLLSLYADTEKSRPSPDALGKPAEEGNKEARRNEMRYGHTSARSSGPMCKAAWSLYNRTYDLFCDTGTTFVDQQDVAEATHYNPTFYYSRHGPATTLHPCLDPMAPFHLAPVFGDGHPDSVTISDLVEAARAEFSSWCVSVHDAAARNGLVIVRFLLGDPLVVARALEYHGCTGEVDSNMFAAPWSMRRMVLSSEEYADRGAPTTFDVIDTSTLWDTVGMFNILSATVPLLSVTSSCDSVLYTESLAWQNGEKTKLPGYKFESFTSDISLWFDLCPVDYLSGFTSRYNTDEVYQDGKRTRTRRHDVLSWKRPCSGDRIARNHPATKLKFQDPDQFAARLEEVYFRLFGDMAWMEFFPPGGDWCRKEREQPDIYMNTRESFVRFLRCARDRFCESEEEWEDVLCKFIDRIIAVDRLDFLSHVELFTELYRLGVGDIEATGDPPKPTSGRLSAWDTIPSLVRVTLIVPHATICSDGLTTYGQSYGAPPLGVFIDGINLTGYIQGLNAGFGRATDVGTEASPRIQLDEDPEGARGTSDLIVSFVVCTRAFTDSLPKPDSEITISLFFMAPPQALRNNEKPIQVRLFEEPFENRDRVLVAPEPESSHAHWPCSWLERRSPSSSSQGSSLPIGEQTYVKLESEDSDDKDGAKRSRTSGVVARLEVQNPRARELYLAPEGCVLDVSQVSPCVVRARIGEQEQDIVFPVPILGSECKVRVPPEFDISDLYVELFVPIETIVFELGGYKIDPIPTISSSDGLTRYPWSVHRVNLDRMPVVNEDGLKLNDWLDDHISAQHSIMDSAVDAMRKEDSRTWALPKRNLFCVLYRPFTTNGRLTAEGKPFRVMALCDWSRDDTGVPRTDTFLFFSDLRYDLYAHTVVTNAYVVTVAAPLTHDAVQSTITGQIASVPMSTAELHVWKKLLPAAAERCRTWSHGPNCEYAATGRVPLEVDMHKGDPLCSCGRGQDVEGMLRVPAWRTLAPHATRIALSPLFPVWYLEPLFQKLVRRTMLVDKQEQPKENPENPQTPVPVCKVCEQAMYDLKRCTRCRSVVYCSQKCQKKDWPTHKAQCKAKAK